jgi:dihydrofolate reductase
VLQGDVIEAVTKLKAAEGGDILMYGYGVLTDTLVRAGLVDEVRFWIHPVFVGGPSVSAPLTDAGTTLTLADTKVMKSGVIIATYTPAAAG